MACHGLTLLWVWVCVWLAVGVKIKLSRNLASIGREADNLRTLRTRGGKAAAQGVINMLDFFENYDG